MINVICVDMKNQLRIFLLVGLVFCVQVLRAQVTISGNVVDAQTSQPIAGVAIVQSGSSNGTISDSNGNFQLKVESLPATLDATYSNYTPANKTVTSEAPITLFLNNQQSTRLTREQILAMSTDELSELSLEELMEAVETLGVSSVDELFALIMNKNVSSASKKEESSFTSPMATTVITHDELRTWGCSTIDEALRLIPGMIVQQKTNGVYDVQMRGLNNIPDNNMLLYTESSNILLMLDGRSMLNYGIGTVNVELLPIAIEDVERIEVVRGAASALYGTNAVNGVINIITRKPDQSKDLVSGSFFMGSQSTYSGEVAIRKAFNNKVAAGISFNMQYRERATDKLRVITNDTLYLDVNSNISSQAKTTSEIQQLIASGALIPVVANQELSVEQFNDLRSIGTNVRGAAKALAAKASAASLVQQNVQAQMQQLIASYMAEGLTQEEATAQAATKQAAIIEAVTEQVTNSILSIGTQSVFYTTPVEYRNTSDVFPDPRLARKNIGINGYLTFNPAPEVNINLTGGYSQSTVNNSTLIENPYSFNFRILKEGYANVDAEVKDLHLQVNYAGGPFEYCYGRPGFNVFYHKFFGIAEYDFNIGDKDTWGSLMIRPGLNYVHVFLKDVDQYYQGTLMPGFVDGDCKITSIAPALRLDYQKGGLRVIAGVRSDKTNIPDKWNTSVLASVGYKFNEKNYLRLNYGRAMRSASIVATNCKYKWLRDSQADDTGMSAPSTIAFDVNKNADIMHADNFELGYRFQPNQKLLFDAEVFYSLSTDYSGMQAKSAKTVVDADASYEAVASHQVEKVFNSIQTEGLIHSNNLPYDVRQFGFGVNIDWIISPKLIAKFNVNAQQTIIDDYYEYDQGKVLTQLVTYSLEDALTMIAAVQSHINAGDQSDEERKVAADAVFDEFKRNGKVDDNGYMNTGEQSVQDLDMSSERGQAIYSLLNPEREDGHKHKATPSVYGMFGFIAKPINKLNLAAYANFIGKREYLTTYGSAELNPRFTVNLKAGFKPTDNLELFFNASNLFNNQKQEFIYADKIGGIYTVGINFGF